MDDDCVICRIIAGQELSRPVMETARALAFLDINPATDGHTLVAPKEHAADIWSLRDEDAQDVWRLAVAVAHRLRDALHPEGMTLFQANRPAGWQDVFHFHLHVVPRWMGDQLVRPWGLTAGDPGRMDEIALKLRSV